jgi:hypothetical protein
LSISTTLLPFLFATTIFILKQIVRKKDQTFIKVLTILLITLAISKSIDFNDIKFNPEIMQKVDIYLSKNVVHKNIQFDKNNQHVFQKLVAGENNIWGIFINNRKEIYTVDVTDYFYPQCFKADYWEQYDNLYMTLLPKRNYSLLEWEKGVGKIKNLKWGLGLREFNVKTDTISILNLKTLYFPGWNISIDSLDSSEEKSSYSCTSDGRISLYLPPGEFNILVSYEGTKYDMIGFHLSFITLISTLVYFVFRISNLWCFSHNEK